MNRSKPAPTPDARARDVIAGLTYFGDLSPLADSIGGLRIECALAWELLEHHGDHLRLTELGRAVRDVLARKGARIHG